LWFVSLAVYPLAAVCGDDPGLAAAGERRTDEIRRIPAEWEPHAATWMQWPKGVESSYRPDFSRIIDALQEYEPIQIIVQSSLARNQAQNYLLNRGVPLSNLHWHIMPYNWAWMRDNGPVWVSIDGGSVVQDWGFDAWGGQYPPWDDDDAVPCRVADIVGVPCESRELITERGNLEFNGAGTVIASWPCQSDRNPGVSQVEMTSEFEQAFGVNEVVWLMSAPPGDLTNGHVDGIARFIDENTVAVVRYVNQSDPDAWIYEEAASIIQAAGFAVERIDMPGYVDYMGSSMPAIYVNWLVTDGAVVATGFGVPAWDNAAKNRIEDFFPAREVHVVETLELWYWGGGVHCVTNDQPLPEATPVAENPAASARAAVRLLPNHPNPFNPSTRLAFETAGAGPARLEIFDAAGRRVATLLDEPVAAGYHELDWDGRDDRGRALPSGIYFARVRSADEVATGRAILLR